MNDNQVSDARRKAVDAYWETFPPLWQRIRGFIRKAAERCDLSVEQFHILRHIRSGRCSVSELAEVRYTSRPAVSQAVDLLVEKGLISRKADPRDRRHVNLALTDLGNARLDEMFSEIRLRMLKIFAPLTDREVQNLLLAMDSLKKIQTL
jgi:DNA-binding MarR family transcriptional regulator